MEGKRRGAALILCTVWSLVTVDFCGAEEFPLRKNYPDVPIFALNEVKAGYDNKSMILVDVQSRMEFETIHADHAVRVDFSHKKFLSELQHGRQALFFDGPPWTARESPLRKSVEQRNCFLSASHPQQHPHEPY